MLTGLGLTARQTQATIGAAYAIHTCGGCLRCTVMQGRTESILHGSATPVEQTLRRGRVHLGKSIPPQPLDGGQGKMSSDTASYPYMASSVATVSPRTSGIPYTRPRAASIQASPRGSLVLWGRQRRMHAGSANWIVSGPARDPYNLFSS